MDRSALTPCRLKEFQEESARTALMEEDEAWVGSKRSIKSRFLKLLEERPNLTRSEAYILAVTEIARL